LKVDLTALSLGESQSLTGDYSSDDLELNTADIEFLTSLHLEGKVTRGDGFLRIAGEISAKLKEACGRCLAKTERGFKREFEIVATVSNDETSYDFTPELREEILVSYSQKLLCSEDCKGLCSNCGANLNVAPCDCYEEEESTNPFSVLKKLKKEKEKE
jgi:uncharacterized protein